MADFRLINNHLENLSNPFPEQRGRPWDEKMGIEESAYIHQVADLQDILKHFSPYEEPIDGKQVPQWLATKILNDTVPGDTLELITYTYILQGLLINESITPGMLPTWTWSIDRFLYPVLTKNNRVYANLPPHIQKDYGILRQACRGSGLFDEDLEHDGVDLPMIPILAHHSLWGDINFILAAMKAGRGDCWAYLASPLIRKNSSFMKKIHFRETQYTSAKTRMPVAVTMALPECFDDEEFVLSNFQENPFSIFLASNRLRSNKEFIMRCAKMNPRSSFVDPLFQREAPALAAADQTLWSQEDFVLEAVDLHEDWITQSPESLRLDFSFMLKVAKGPGSYEALKHSNLRSNRTSMSAMEEGRKVLPQ